MSTDLLIAGVLIVGALAFALWPRKRPLSIAPIVTDAGPGRTLLDSIEEAGKDGAAKIVEAKLGEQKAKEILGSLTAAFAADSAPSPKTPAA